MAFFLGGEEEGAPKGISKQFIQIWRPFRFFTSQNNIFQPKKKKNCPKFFALPSLNLIWHKDKGPPIYQFSHFASLMLVERATTDKKKGNHVPSV